MTSTNLEGILSNYPKIMEIVKAPVFPGHIRNYYSGEGGKTVTMDRAKKKIIEDIEKLVKKDPKKLYSLEFIVSTIKGALEASEVNRDPIEAIYNLRGFIIPLAEKDPIKRWEPEYINKFRNIMELLVDYATSKDNPYAEIGVFLAFVYSGLELHKKYGNIAKSCKDLDKKIIDLYSDFPRVSTEEIIEKSSSLILACSEEAGRYKRAKVLY